MHKPLIALIAQLLLALPLSAQTTGEYTQRELRDSLSMINGLIEKHPRAVKLRLRKAALNIELDEWQYALDEYTNVLEMMPTNLTALYYRGFVNQHLKRYAFARKDYEQLLLVDQRNEHALMGLILTNLADGHTTEAFDQANRLVDYYPESANSYATRAEVEKEQHMLEPALQDIQKAISIEDIAVQKRYPVTLDDDITAYQLTAFSILMAQGKTTEAKQCLDYLVKNGIQRVYLNDYFLQLKAAKGK